ncbi:Mitochondrial inner membrane protease atp23 [Friedmanniomyces endolithicus]|uniref:Mitochondrial inner membrane protease ATP23 n=1 Tax=Friedmanniomyces endolithicus TaxID=329885 RepID=A0AAN6H436_9PEZI|nr:Mitochondrial inner membrane protease atp23 [Friedmanniomyces endolithicus]KAK0954151.1 Mitochondrial inner membrane protease atp23 [Friedmanniomyces endolithicus]KAK1005187.1 Mitochondrial inner membrane protease atp23 [Friedmanniomyces endolithicus]KAK1022965.1 Mitochondrial inner membrane protease atp23 [Friedmanniomyces endolithicus]
MSFTASTTPSTAGPSPSTTSSAKPLDPAYYTWSNFFSILTGTATPHDRDQYFRTKDTINEARDCARCDKDKAWLFAYSPVIRFMKHNIDLLGPDSGTASITPENVRCRRCDTKQSGGFDSEYGILVCANHLRNRGRLEDTIAHEMVHAYDHLRFKLDPYDLRHAACMEIRASTLSGECRWTREFFTRNQWGLTQQLQECVRRRATLSVAARSGCKDEAMAGRMVSEVWDSCFRDTRPFDEIYR